MSILKRAVILVPAPLEALFDFTSDHRRFPLYVFKKGIIPGVVRTETLEGAESGVGSKRLVIMTDKSEMIEEVTLFERPHSVAYRWGSRPAAPFCWLVRDAVATWSFTPREGLVEVEWRYEFEPGSVLLRPLTLLVLVAFERWMKAALDALGPAYSKA